MAQTLQQPTQGQDHGLSKRGASALGDRAFWVLTLISGLLVLAILALILFTTVQKSLPVFQEEGLSFFTSSVWVPNDPDGDGPRTAQFGALAFIYGTMVVSLIAMLVAVPISIGIALFLTELAPPRIRAIAVTIIDLLAAVPSVVFGLWAIIVVAPAIVPFYNTLHDIFGPHPDPRLASSARPRAAAGPS